MQMESSPSVPSVQPTGACYCSESEISVLTAAKND